MSGPSPRWTAASWCAPKRTGGAQVEADVPTSTHFLGAGLEAWLADLRTAAEG
ncbi:hypothetical protein [Nocardia abscessus]|uniref:hypothetical protein n=1 Tax=Nocardia abscessus TaxID=120957 RepID=UPI0002FF5447|nr:hypothetical protein [Nocardia abscessus]MCC3331223.1 hypothetical protein [Nocardia abscessus]